MPQPGFTSVAAKGVAVNRGGGHSGGLPWVPDSVPQVCVSPQTAPAPSPSTLRVAGPVTPLLRSSFLCQMWKCRSDPVLHIDLRRWADLMLVAPLDANTLGKVASGICDNLLVSGSPGLPPRSPWAGCRLLLDSLLTWESLYGGLVCSEHSPLDHLPPGCTYALAGGQMAWVLIGWT